MSLPRRVSSGCRVEPAIDAEPGWLRTFLLKNRSAQHSARPLDSALVDLADRAFRPLGTSVPTARPHPRPLGPNDQPAKVQGMARGPCSTASRLCRAVEAVRFVATSRRPVPTPTPLVIMRL